MLNPSLLSVDWSDWLDASFQYDETVPRSMLLALAACAAGALAISAKGLLAFPLSDTSVATATTLGGIATAVMIAKWAFFDDARSVLAASILSLLFGAGAIERLAAGAHGTLHAGHAMLLGAPVVLPLLMRSWAMVAWCRRLQESTDLARAAVGRVLGCNPGPGEYLLRVEPGQTGDEVRVVFFDGTKESPGVAPKGMVTWPDRGGWYVSEGVVLVEEVGNAAREGYRDPGRMLRMRDKMGRTRPLPGGDPRVPIAYSFYTELVTWTLSAAAVLAISGVLAWRAAVWMR